MWPMKPKTKNTKRGGMSGIVKRLFSAAKTEEFWYSWSKSAKTIDQVVFEDQVSLIARSREQYANNNYVKRFVKLSQTNIVGENGITVQSTVKDRKGEPDRAVQQIIEDDWKQFSMGVDASGDMSRAEFEGLAVQSCAINGEAFVVQQVSAAYKYGIAYYFLDPLLCPVSYNDPNQNIIGGIKYALDGAPIEYYFKTSVEQQGYTVLSAAQCWHVYLPEWVGQKRGIPWTATSLGDLRTLDGYIEAALVNARVGAAKMGFFQTTGDNTYVGEDDSDGNLIMDAEAGSFEQLPEGVTLAQWDPDYPHQQFGEFVGANLRGVSVGLGVSHHSLTGDMTGVNYTSSRTALLDERDNWKIKQKWLANRLTKKMYQSFLTYGIDFGKINFNGRPLREQPEFYFKATYQGRRWAWVDPKKEVDAAREAISLKVKSRSAIIREEGQDPDTVWEEMARDSQTIDGLGLNVDNSTEEQAEVDDETND